MISKGLMISRILYLLGSYLKEKGYTEKNPAEVTYEFHNEIFSFGTDETGTYSYFEYFPSNYYCEWYLWVERGVDSETDLTAEEGINMLIQCISSLGSLDVTSDGKFRWDDVILDWVPNEDSEEDS